MFVLKSASPRRIQLLQELGLKFEIQPSNINESLQKNENYMEYLKRITLDKLEVSKAKPQNVYVSADTIVVNGNTVLTKPTNEEDAISTLKILSGKNHFVYSGIAFYKSGEIIFDFDKTEVLMKNWKLKEITNYVEKYRPLDKAGSYGIQDIHSPVQSIKGSFQNVVGFPLKKFYIYNHLWKDFLCL